MFLTPFNLFVYGWRKDNLDVAEYTTHAAPEFTRVLTFKLVVYNISQLFAHRRCAAVVHNNYFTALV